MSDFRKLEVWRKGHALVINVYRAAGRMRAGRYGSLRNQMTRAAMSIPSNIVEGSGKQSRREFARFLRIALNSGRELEYHLRVARDIKAMSVADYASLNSQTVEVKKMLHGLLTRIVASLETPQR